MKKIIVLLIALLMVSSTNLKAQNIYVDPDFLIATNNLFSACLSLDAIVKSDNNLGNRNKNLPIIKSNLASSRAHYGRILPKYANSEDLKKLKLWNDVLQKTVESLSAEDWQSDGTWQLAYTLIKMDLQDLVNLKL